MSIGGRLKNHGAACITALLPRDCLLCGAASRESPLCPECAASLPQLDSRLGNFCCPICAMPTPAAGACGACLAHPPHFDATAALWHYAFPVDQLIQSLKYARRLAGADFLGKALAALPVSTPPDIILPVPLALARLQERGFNQSVEIARPLARRLGTPLELNHIHRRRNTAPQASLPWKERAKNIRHAFECTIDLSGKTVLVVDDVMTTGATLNELARTLKAQGAARVENCIVARTLKDS